MQLRFAKVEDDLVIIVGSVKLGPPQSSRAKVGTSCGLQFKEKKSLKYGTLSLA